MSRYTHRPPSTGSIGLLVGVVVLALHLFGVL